MKMTLYRITVLSHINNSIKFASLLKVPFVTWNKFHLTTIFGFFTSKEVLPHISIQVVSHTNCNDNKDVFLEHYKSITIGAITLFSHARSLKIISPWKVSCNLECTRFLDNNIKKVWLLYKVVFFIKTFFNSYQMVHINIEELNNLTLRAVWYIVMYYNIKYHYIRTKEDF